MWPSDEAQATQELAPGIHAGAKGGGGIAGSTETPVMQALGRLASMVERNQKKTSMLKERLTPVLDLSPRPESPSAGNKVGEPSKINIVEILNYFADRLSQNGAELDDIFDRIQL